MPVPVEPALAALDLGTNSFHLVVARVGPHGYDVITREKESIRLGHGGGDMKHLSDEAMDRGIAALTRMRRIADAHDAPVRTVATSAVREAENAQEFLARAHTEAGIEIEVISGVEEARLIHLGVLQSVPAFDRRLLLIDIGGGSTEVLVGERGRTLAARSFKLGAVRLTDRFFPEGRTSDASVRACRDYVRSILAVFEREVAALGFDIAVGSSGTVETIARLVQARRGGPTPKSFNLFVHSRDELDEVVAALVDARTPAARLAVRGLEVGRADIIPAGAIVLQAVAHAFDVQNLTYSESALREGVLIDTIARRQDGVLQALRDVARQSVDALAARCDDDVAHSRHVATLALALFDATSALHGLGATARHHLEAAALLANVGLVISHSKHHLHSYYVIRNSELAGLTDNEIELIAQIARYHRKSAPKASHTEFQRLGPDDQRLVCSLAGLLRIAIGLDRAHDGRVASVRAVVLDGRLVVEAVAHDGADVTLEAYTAQERSGLLATVLAMPVDVVPAPGPA